jgi:hypothetical protein
MFVTVKVLYGTWEEGKEKRMIEHQQCQIHNICAGRGHNDMY